MSKVNGLQKWARGQEAPVTMAFLVTVILTTLLLSSGDSRLFFSLAMSPDWATHPWSLVTYPWAHRPVVGVWDLVWVAAEAYAIYWFGNQVEREMRSGRYAALLGIFIVLAGALTAAGGGMSPGEWVIAGPWLPFAGIVVCWCVRHPGRVFRVYFGIPIRALWVAWFAAAAVFISFAPTGPLMGLLACVHLALAWAFADDRLPVRYAASGGSRATAEPIRKGAVVYDEKYYDEVKRREKEREERERLRKLFGETSEEDK